MNVITWFALGFSLTGNLLINNQNVFGYIAWIVSNVLWIIYAVHKRITAQIVLFVIYIIFSIHGIYSWGGLDWLLK